jgi:hypothetical protein
MFVASVLHLQPRCIAVALQLHPVGPRASPPISARDAVLRAKPPGLLRGAARARHARSDAACCNRKT